ncbi:MAG: 4-hydroxy-tetrahydrodipicolinate reductase [Spirochaetia bacterium]|nr:4-hydroxy-tetrahydrodipicolinate reductase [Spirochaetia bacterium]
MNIAINGYGRMGRLIRKCALERGHAVTSVIDPNVDLPEVTSRVLSDQSIGDADLVIDFSIPSSALNNIEIISRAGVNAVIGTTGWYEAAGAAEKIVVEAGTGLLWSGNFSLGVNILFHLIRTAGKIMNYFPEYDAMIHEFHHSGKVDSPSGTAEMLSSILIEEIERKGEIVTDSLSRKIAPGELHVSSTRGGSIPGTHTILFDSEDDTIEITHRARNRNGFALGAVKAAEWMQGKTGFFSIDDMMKTIIASV